MIQGLKEVGRAEARFRGCDSEFLRTQHGEDEVNEESEGDEADDEVFHDGWWLKGGGSGPLQSSFSQKKAYAAQPAKKTTETPR